MLAVVVVERKIPVHLVLGAQVVEEMVIIQLRVQLEPLIPAAVAVAVVAFYLLMSTKTAEQAAPALLS
jgi:hypothetical protein